MNKRHALTFIVITVLVDLIGFGIIMPVIPQLLVEITGEPLSDASRWGGWLLFSFAFTSFFFSPVLGNLSDRFGRRPVLLFSLTIYGINYLIMGFAETLLLLFIGRLITGAAGATNATASAFIADISSDEDRAQNFGLLGMAFGFGFILGPIIGGLLGELGPRVPFFAAAALGFANALYGYFVLPETLAEAHRRPFKLARANPVGAVIHLGRYPIVLALASAMLFYHIGHHVYPSIWAFFTIEKFNWSPADVGWSLGAVGLGAALVSGLLIRWAIPKFGQRVCAIFGLLCAISAYAGFAFAPNAVVVYAVIGLSALAGLTMPSLQGIMTSRVPKDQQGELQGALASLGGLGAIIGPLSMTQVFADWTSADATLYFPGAPFLLAAGLTTITLLIVLPLLLFALNKPLPSEAG